MDSTLRLDETDNPPLDGAAADDAARLSVTQSQVSDEPLPKKGQDPGRPPRPVQMVLTQGSLDSDNSSQQASSEEPLSKKSLEFSRPIRPGPAQMSLTLASIDSDHSQQDEYARPRPGGGGRPNNLFLNFSGTLSSLGGTARSDMVLSKPSTPLPERKDYKTITGKVDVIIFDFDGTLTATPGDRQVRSQKRIEIGERASLLQSRLRALREAGCVLGILSKSTEVTIRDALAVGGLTDFFEAPVIGKAVGLEGKAGFIRNMVQAGSLRLPGDRRTGLALHRILLVDDDVLELERARAAGIQTYAAPIDGGLQEEDFQNILDSLKLPSSRPPRVCSLQRSSSGSVPAIPTAAATHPWFPTKFLDKPGPPHANGKWRNLILFSGDCFEG